jgi:hypothetical protein
VIPIGGETGTSMDYNNRTVIHDEIVIKKVFNLKRDEIIKDRTFLLIILWF